MADPEVEIAVLGQIQIRGAAQPFSRSASKELVVYLAFHRWDIRNDVWADALWPGRLVAPATLHSTSSDARRGLGRALCGAHHLPRRGRRLRLEDTAVSDVELFAQGASSSEPMAWRRALRLVRGRPFEGLSLTDWTVLDGTQAEVETLVVATALKYAGHALAQGQGADAEWAIRRALRASPYDERLYRALLRALEAQGNRMGIRATMAEILSIAPESESGPPGIRARGAQCAVHPQTVELYRMLAQEEVPAARGYPVRL